MHLSEADLILHVYDEADDGGRIGAHLAGCEACRRQRERLRHTLALVDEAAVPARPAGYEEDLWRRIEPAIARRRRWTAWAGGAPRWAAAAAVAALLLAGFLAGRVSRPEPAGPAETDTSAHTAAARERILLVAVGEHLERSQMALIELISGGADGPAGIAVERERAGDLVAANRLYRQTAARAGEAAIADVLADLERVLIDVAAGPAELTARDLEWIRERVEARGILFRMRVISSEMRARERNVPPAAPASS